MASTHRDLEFIGQQLMEVFFFLKNKSTYLHVRQPLRVLRFDTAVKVPVFILA